MFNAISYSIAAMLALGSGKPAPKVTPAHSNADANSFVLVENNRNVPVRVYAETSFGEHALGIVPANCVTSLRLDPVLAATRRVDFLLDPRGQPLEDTGLVAVQPGKGVEVIVPQRW